MPEKDDDEWLAERYSGTGDLRVLETLYRRHAEGVYRFTRRFLTLQEDAEEAASECWFRAFNALRAGQYRGESRFRTWLFGVARLVCLERLRQPRLPTLSLADFADPERAPMLSTTARVSPLDSALASLAEDHQLVLTLCDLEGFTTAEAAPVLNRTPAATKSLHIRARRALKEALEREQEELA